MGFHSKKFLFAWFLSVFSVCAQSVSISCPHGLIVSCKNKDTSIKKITVCVSGNTLRINGRKMPRSPLIITPKKGSLYVGNKEINEPVVLNNEQNVLTITRLKEKENTDKMIRVLLAQKDKESKEPWSVRSPSGFLLKANGSSLIIREPALAIRFFKDSLWLNNKRIKNECTLQPLEGVIAFNEDYYDGFFRIIYDTDANTALLINVLDLESYVCSVLKTESWPGWPLEVNKVFAITSRTYAISMMFDAKKQNRLYDVKNTNIHQTYSGDHAIPIYKRAAESTKGIFLAHDNKPILAMFDSCCGGVIPAHIDGIDFNKAPYLAREYPCIFCKSYRIFKWQVEYPLTEFAAKFDAFTVKKIKDLKILKTDRAGLVQEIEIMGYPNNINISSKQLYNVLDEMKSYCFSICKKFGKIQINGRGFGHHLGLCQWGARQMVHKGWDYKSILNFYYPDCRFMKLKL